MVWGCLNILELVLRTKNFVNISSIFQGKFRESFGPKDWIFPKFCDNIQNFGKNENIGEHIIYNFSTNFFRGQGNSSEKRQNFAVSFQNFTKTATLQVGAPMISGGESLYHLGKIQRSWCQRSWWKHHVEKIYLYRMVLCYERNIILSIYIIVTKVNKIRLNWWSIDIDEILYIYCLNDLYCHI